MKSKTKNHVLFVNKCITYIVLALLAVEIPAARIICENLALWMQRVIPFVIFTRSLGAWRISVERVLLVALLLLVADRGVCEILLRRNTYNTMQATGNNAFETSLLRYLNKSNIEGCFLISGNWGIGKTFKLTKFINKYYISTKRNVYSLSCFGLTEREDVIKELNKLVEEGDYSLNSTFVEVLSIIPVIGEFLGHLLKKNYSYGKVVENSIFIFEDFERVVHRMKHKNANLANNYNSVTWGNHNDEKLIDEIHSNVNALNDIRNIIRDQSIKEDYDNYLALTGVINEIVDRYHCKVIIVCNTEAMGEQFVSEVLRSKLNCREYRLFASPDARKQLAKRITENFTLENKEKRAFIDGYIRSLDLMTAKRNLNSDNLRLIANIIEAFMVTADLFELSTLRQDGFMDSLYYSVLATNSSIMNNYEGKLKNKKTGTDIRLFYRDEEVSSRKNCKWIDYSVSAYYFKNMERPRNIDEIVTAWCNYKYSDIEKCLLKKDYSAFDIYDYDIIHVCILIRDIKADDAISVDWKKYLERILNTYDLKNKNELNKLLGELSSNMEGVYYSEISEAIFEMIAKQNDCLRCDDKQYYAMQYNEYIERMHKQ